MVGSGVSRARQTAILAPDVVVLDARHPLSLVTQLTKAAPAATVIVHDPDGAASQADALAAGAAAHVVTPGYRYQPLADAMAAAVAELPF